MSFDRFNAYKIMWLFCLFDLPTKTKAQRKRAAALYVMAATWSAVIMTCHGQ